MVTPDFFRELTTMIRGFHMIMDSVSGTQKEPNLQWSKKKHKQKIRFVTFILKNRIIDGDDEK